MTIKLFFHKFSNHEVQSSRLLRLLFAPLLLAALATGCAVPEPPKLTVTTVPDAIVQKPVALTVEADSALQAAEQGVIEARIKRALWTSAVEELSRARIAAKEFDSAGTLRHARETIILCELSIAQLSKVPVKW